MDMLHVSSQSRALAERKAPNLEHAVLTIEGTKQEDSIKLVKHIVLVTASELSNIPLA